MSTWFLAVLISLAVPVESAELIFTQVLFRHGARAPSEMLTNDSFRDHFPRGLGELTDRGFENSYKLGKFLKKRYVDAGFLNKDLIPYEMYWRSVNKRRCLSTASAVGAAMFEDPVRHLHVPVFTDEFGENLLSYDQSNCPRETELVKQRCPEFTGQFDPWPMYEEFIASCVNYTHPAFAKHPFRILEAHMNEYKNGLPLPPLLDSNIDEIMSMYSKVVQFITGTGVHHNKDVMRMKFGYLVHTLLANVIEGNDTYQRNIPRREKFKVYSTQDWILMGVLDSFGVFKEAVGFDRYPEYNSMIIIEMWANQKNEVFVKMFYKKEEETEEDHTLIDVTKHVRNCQNSAADGCSFEDFIKCCTDYTYSKPGYLCQLNSQRKRSAGGIFGNIRGTKQREKRFAGPA